MRAPPTSRPRSRIFSALLPLAAGVLALSVSACGGSHGESSPPAASQPDAPPQEPEPTAPKNPKEPRGPIDPAKVGTIRGVVHFEGDPPRRETIKIGGAGGCPEHPTPQLTEDAIVENGHLANVFVSIKSGFDGWDIPPAKDDSLTMDQKGCVYTPHVLGMRLGQRLLVHNTDPTTHNVNIRSRNNDALNPIQAPGGQPVEWRPSKKELAVPFECNLHTWMHAWVHVVDHPWFAVSASDGSFVLEGVPPGEYVLEAWHEKYGKKTANVSLDPGQNPEVGFTFKPTDKPK